MPNFKSLSQAAHTACKKPELRSMRLFYFIFLLVASASHAAFAQVSGDIEDPSLVAYLKANVVQSGEVSVTGGSIDWVKLNITIPQNADNQRVSDSQTKLRDPFGNYLWEYEVKNPPETARYSGENLVEIYSRATKDLPAAYSVPESAKRYILPSEGMQSKDARIISLAKNITQDAASDFEKIAALAMFVHNYVNYTKSLGTTAKDALWVLDNKIGTCDEYSTLFIALSRALGYPARYVSGYVWGADGWIPHAWAEVYLGKWVPVDATWLEVGWLDATHIQFHISDDNKVENSAVAYGTGSKTVSWLSSDTKIENIAIEYRSKTQEYTLTQTAKRIAPAEKTIVALRIMPDEFSVIEASLEPCKGSSRPIVSVGNKKQEAILAPGRERVLFWEVSAERDLPKDMIYTCPLVLNSRLLGEKRIDIIVDTSGDAADTAELSADVKSSSIVFGETETVFSGAKRTGGLGEYVIGIITPEYYGEKTSASDTISADFSFIPRALGNNRAILFSSTGQAKDISYAVKASAETRITQISVPKFIGVGKTENITLIVTSPGAASMPMRISMNIGGNESVQNFALEKSAKITFEYTPDSAGEKTARFELTGNGAGDVRIEKFRAYDVPDIAATISEDYREKTASIRLVAIGDSAENVSVKFLGAEKGVGTLSGSTDAAFDLPAPGIYEAEVLFYDAAGGAHAKKFALEAKKEGVFRKIKRVLLSFLGK